MTIDRLLEIEDKASVRKYFGMIPHLVWEIALTPIEVALYTYFVRVAGEEGVCWQSTRTIAERTGISAGKISAARKVLDAAGLICQGLQHRHVGGQGRYLIHVRILDNWLLNVGFFSKEEKYIHQVEVLKSKIIDLRSSSEHSTCVQSMADLRSPGEPKKNPLKKNPKKREESKDVSNPTPSLPADPKSATALRGTNKRPKRVIAGTGDSQRDRVDAAAAGPNTVQAKELVARAMYQVVKKDLEYPEGKTKAAKNARYPMERAAEDVLEQIGRENWQEALDACHLLLTEPTPSEAAWLEKVDKVGGIVGTVTKRVSQLRGAARKRAAAVERNRSILDFPVYLDSEMDPNTVGVVSGVRIGRIVNIGPDVPHECADIWRGALEDMELQSGHPETLLRRAVLQEVTGDTWIIDLNNQVSMGWARIKLKPAVERTLTLVAGRQMQVSFVARNGAENGNQDED